MKKTVFLLALALLIGTFAYSQILGGPTYQTEKPDRDRPIADVDIEYNINDIIILPDEKETSETIILSTIEFVEIVTQGGSAGINIIDDKLPRYKCFIVEDSKPSPTGIPHQIKCVRVR